MSALQVVRIHVGSADYRQMLDLRDRVLRRPLGMRLSDHDTAGDAAASLLVAKDGERVVGCCLLTSEDGFVQLRAMAVDASRRAQGVGRAIVAHAESLVRDDGPSEIRLDARAEAIGFYARLGYVAEGAAYEKVGIPHRLMRKRLRR